jgi:hypothetical protein
MLSSALMYDVFLCVCLSWSCYVLICVCVCALCCSVCDLLCFALRCFVVLSGVVVCRVFVARCVYVACCVRVFCFVMIWCVPHCCDLLYWSCHMIRGGLRCLVLPYRVLL